MRIYPSFACMSNKYRIRFDSYCMFMVLSIYESLFTGLAYYKIPTVRLYILCDISCSIITAHQGEVAKDITEEIIMELLLPILGVGVALMLLIHQEHLVEDMEKEEVIITDLETIM